MLLSASAVRGDTMGPPSAHAKRQSMYSGVFVKDLPHRCYARVDQGLQDHPTYRHSTCVSSP